MFAISEHRPTYYVKRPTVPETGLALWAFVDANDADDPWRSFRLAHPGEARLPPDAQTGEVWQYMGTELHGVDVAGTLVYEWRHVFRHRHHPVSATRDYIRVEPSGPALSSLWAAADRLMASEGD